MNVLHVSLNVPLLDCVAGGDHGTEGKIQQYEFNLNGDSQMVKKRLQRLSCLISK